MVTSRSGRRTRSPPGQAVASLDVDEHHKNQSGTGVLNGVKEPAGVGVALECPESAQVTDELVDAPHENGAPSGVAHRFSSSRAATRRGTAKKTANSTKMTVRRPRRAIVAGSRRPRVTILSPASVSGHQRAEGKGFEPSMSLHS